MKTNTINNEQVKNVNECELSENELDQVNGGNGLAIAGFGTALGYAGMLLTFSGIGAPVGAIMWGAGAAIGVYGEVEAVHELFD